MQRLLLILILILAPFTHIIGKGRSVPDFTFGTEWGYMPTFAHGYNFNFFDTEGFRVLSTESGLKYFTNGEVSLHFGYNFNDRWNLSLYAGYSGAAGFEPIIPLSLRATRYWSENTLGDRWFTFMDLGSGLCLKNEPQEIALCKIGSGYRLSLSKVTKLDFIVAIRGLYTHPEIIYYNETVSAERTVYNNGYAVSLFFGAGLTF